MKISTKLTLSSIAITAAAIILCSIILLITTADNHISSAVRSGTSELRMLTNAFHAEMGVIDKDADLSDTAKRSLILYIFKKYTSTSVSGAHYILSNSEGIMYNDCPIDPRPSLPDLKTNPEEVEPSTIVELEGRKYLVTGHYDEWLGNGRGDGFYFEHEIYLVRDITDVYNGIVKLGIWFTLIAFGTIIFCVLTMVLTIRNTLSPLSVLRENAAELADGNYNNRIQVKGSNEIDELGVSLNRMADAVSSHIKTLEDISEQRKMLLSALTHELKTPMTAIIGYSETLMRVSLSKEQKDDSIAYINRECRRIERLSQKMIQLITLQNGECPYIKRLPVSELYDTAKDIFMGAAQKEDIILSFEDKCNTSFDVDADMMVSVLINLLDNARKAGAKHIHVEANQNSIVIRDDGKGIPESEIPKITQPFYMIDKSYSQSIGGSGLGLAICDLILAVHNAHLHIESRQGAGTAISILFDT